MSEAITQTTELEAVNKMLRCIGESPVNELEGDDEEISADVAVAKDTLRDIAKEVLAQGWHFNTEHNYPLLPAEDGTVSVPANTIRVVIPRQFGSLVRRDNRIYDRVNHTFNIGKKLIVGLYLFLPFDECPESFRRYVMIRAARQFADAQDGDAQQHIYNQQDEMAARSTLVEEEGDTADYNILDGLREAYTTRRNHPRRFF